VTSTTAPPPEWDGLADAVGLGVDEPHEDRTIQREAAATATGTVRIRLCSRRGRAVAMRGG
jgi:hypothetical protein